MSTVEIDTAAISEADRVVCWRACELIRVGYPDTLAVVLAERTDIDLHRALELVKKGCPPELAARILL